ncbi:hypothetical protein [Cellulomonas denverensis]|uniref:Tail assembly chaperone n=1 Tax=Cellulomonas denverensis TaxID=264297 RepID=A0A7X6QYK0_9CELL|nr:hypothetical protein [Cellulomonas denverensis]NKY22224.1 hypothetical protein [Cellulomonas denverensis]GIG27190.1 hypothetical protein Cde04nite_34340 [Cellulomonas denverensis]
MSITMTRPTQRVEFCTNLSLKAEHEAAVAALAEANKAGQADQRETGNTAVRAAAERVQEIEKVMREHTLVFTLEAWPRKRWAEWEALHPPREGNEGDKALGVDVSGLDKVLGGDVADGHSWPAAITGVTTLDGDEVPFDPGSNWPELADEMTSAQWNDFALAILKLNNGVTAAPFSSLASVVIRRSEQTSKPQNG